MKTVTEFVSHTDEELARLALEDEDAFYCLIKRYEKKLLRYLRRLLSANLEACEDVLQEVFIKLYRKLNSFDTKLKFSSWVYRIARNEAISYYRKHKKQLQELSLDDEENGDYINLLKDTFDIQKELRVKELAVEIQGILARLPRKYRDVLILKYLEEKDYKEISNILKKPMGTVATLINRAKKMFHKEAADRFLIKNETI